ncbi:NUDIX domain-containing protein [Streptomyces sp. HC44]|uniref:8-oxo-dGTP diphosphatase n=1 Tax=Streptomyces scabichelini TaxID=2711217 RepID=A0A6G4VCG0_9ACTN|nr:NUDIX domain-containing protein [Streptomyces scabichelini]NGO11493.1 NUDIX domain-containing protein [Streptomyces scabichelini]
MVVVAAVIVQEGRLLVVSKQAAPDVFYLPGGKPDAGEELMDALVRELDEELGVRPVEPRFLVDVEAEAALERVPMKLTLYEAGIDGVPRPAAELAHMRWISGRENDLRFSPALRDHLLPLLRASGALA